MPRPKGSKNHKKMGRPIIDINKTQFEKMCACFSTKEEICSYFCCGLETLQRWCKRTYIDEQGVGLTFERAYKKQSDFGRTSLRSKMYQNAIKDNNTTAQIFLAKNQLGMSDKVEHTIEDDGQLKEFAQIIRELKK